MFNSRFNYIQLYAASPWRFNHKIRGMEFKGLYLKSWPHFLKHKCEWLISKRLHKFNKGVMIKYCKTYIQKPTGSISPGCSAFHHNLLQPALVNGQTHSKSLNFSLQGHKHCDMNQIKIKFWEFVSHKLLPTLVLLSMIIIDQKNSLHVSFS